MEQLFSLSKKSTLHLFILLPLILTAGLARAENTPAGTVISNIAVVNYDVTGTPQPPENSNTSSLLVDRKLDVNVVEASSGRTAVAPGDMAAAYKCLGFDVTNEGNAIQDFILTLSNQSGGSDPFGGTDNFDVAAGLSAVVDDGDGICNAADTADYINDLPSGNTVRVWVKGDISLARIEGDIAAVILTAQIAESAGAPGAAITADASGNIDDPYSVDDVLADETGDTDASNDGKDSDTDSFMVSNAAVSLVKSVSILDPSGGSGPIPGAVLTYTITVTVSGSETAQNVLITDPVPADTTYMPGTLTLDAGTLTDASDGDVGDVGVSIPNTVTVSLGNLTSASPAHTITFKTSIN